MIRSLAIVYFQLDDYIDSLNRSEIKFSLQIVYIQSKDRKLTKNSRVLSVEGLYTL